MLKKDDEGWLCQAYPGLVPTHTGLAGTIEFNASYDAGSDLFRILGEGVPDEVGGLALAGRFEIRIEERTVNPFQHCRRFMLKEWSLVLTVTLAGIRVLVCAVLSKKTNSSRLSLNLGCLWRSLSFPSFTARSSTICIGVGRGRSIPTLPPACLSHMANFLIRPK